MQCRKDYFFEEGAIVKDDDNHFTKIGEDGKVTDGELDWRTSVHADVLAKNMFRK